MTAHRKRYSHGQKSKREALGSLIEVVREMHVDREGPCDGDGRHEHTSSETRGREYGD